VNARQCFKCRVLQETCSEKEVGAEGEDSASSIVIGCQTALHITCARQDNLSVCTFISIYLYM